jgi:hypothetical protein
MSGWYKQQRSIVGRPWFKDAEAVQLYMFLKSTAYVVDGPYMGQVIRRGSCPTTRPDIMEATGLSYKKVDRCLKLLASYNEIIVRGNNKFSVVTICDYDRLNASEDLFDAYTELQENDKGTTKELPEYDKGTTNDTAHLLNKEYKNIEEYKSLITPYSPYKTERESEDFALEVKKRYNKLFDGVLPPLIRLHLPIRNKVMECVRRFGKQSVDIVFDQVRHERFSMGDNKTGFIASFQFIFEPAEYQKYLERAQLRKKRQAETQQAPETKTEPQPSKGSWVDAYIKDNNWKPKA